MNLIKKLVFISVPILCLGASTSLAKNQKSKDVDNSRQNRKHSVTAESQSSNLLDIQITRNIRKKLVADKNLSLYAKNIKIITRNGLVQLKGPVKNMADKDQVETIAKSEAGASKIVSQLEIKKYSRKKL
jgi:osmotically-inducible protein OsmY